MNLLLLASPIYMLQVFDRVLSGRSVETLVFLSVAVALALVVMGALDACRSMLLARFGDWMETRLNRDLMRASLALSAKPNAVPAHQPMADLSNVRAFLSSAGPGAFFDAPLMPFFIAVIWLVEPVLGYIALGAALLLAAMALLSELSTRKSTAAAMETGAAGQALLTGALANADLAQTMGLTTGLARRWSAMRETTSAHLLKSTTFLGVLGTSSKALRLAIQAAILGVGAYLVLQQAITPGEMIACSIILARALAPVETAIGSWRQFLTARQAWRRLIGLLALQAGQSAGLELPKPEGSLEADKLMLATAPGSAPILRAVSFAVPAGATLGIMGPSGSGKSSLARLLAGAWSPSAGTVRLGHADLRQWEDDALGQHIGFLPQSAELFDGTVRDNIARFAECPLDAVVRAAEKAGAHDAILGLPNGYDTQAGPRGERLSGGQRQRVALARAVFGDPRLVVMDEPDTNLDHAGMEALKACIDTLQAEGRTLVIVAHRENTLSLCDWLLVMSAGQVQAFGTAKDVTKRLKLRPAGATPLRPVPVQTGGGGA